MRVALDTSVLVAFFLPADELHEKAKKLIDKIIKSEVEYSCVSVINIIELGYVLERVVDKDFAYNSMYAVMYEMPVDIVEVTWDFIVSHSHLKASNPISFCDNATIASAELTSSIPLFTKEKEVVIKAKKLKGPKIQFLEDVEI